jgi:RNA polymerase sigma-70 factor (ECF subfamily)
MFRKLLNKKTDEALMQLLQQGDAKALSELYSRYSKPLVRYFYRMLWRDAALAQDLLQDLFVKLIERPQYFNVERKFSTWIYSVAHNMCKNQYRKHQYDRQAKVDMHDEHIEGKESNIVSDLDHREFAKTLDKVMTHWEEDDRSLFVLRHEMEMSFPEIATVLNCAEGTAKSRWFYLRKELAQQLHEFQNVLKQ